jgi:hypothetical protein
MVNRKSAHIFKRILESWNSAQNAKNSQKAAGEKYEVRAVTIRALTIARPYAKRTI